MYNPGFGAFLQRLFFSLLFIASGIMHVMGWDATVQGTASVFGQQLSIPLSIGAVVALIGAGGCLLLGFMTRFAGFLIALFLILGMYSHWTWSGMAMDDMLRQAQMAHMFKNFALLGVALRYGFGG